MKHRSEEEKRSYSLQADVIPNQNLALIMLFIISVIAVCIILTELDIFRVGKRQMLSGGILSIILLVVPQFFRFGNLMARPSVKYIMISCVSVVMLVITTTLMFHTTMCLIIPMLTSTFYKDTKIAWFSVFCSVLISILSPIVSFVDGIWDSLFLQVLLQFCGFDSAPALTPFFTLSESVSQIALYLVLPRVLIVLVIGIGTIRIAQGNKIALDDRMELVRTNEQILSMQEDTLECLANIIEQRDGNTGAHVQNTRNYMRAFTDYLLNAGTGSLTPELADRIVEASVLHDIGKVSVSDLILNKPGRLTEEEFEVMKTHCLEGDKLISKAFADNPDRVFVQTAHEIVAFHHEKVDGSGYPYGLYRDEIPLAARMMAIVDAFDAITSVRVYKDALSEEEAYAILRQDSGSHFDGALVEAFIASRKE